MMEATTDTDTAIIAHRGFCGVYPENSLFAINALQKHSVAAVELDVMPTSDGVPVLCHDETLERVSHGLKTERKVWDISSEKITEMSIFQTDQTIPTLKNALDKLPSSIDVQIELKNPGIEDIYVGRCPSKKIINNQVDKWIPFIKNVINILEKGNNEYTIASSREACLAATTHIDENIDTVYFEFDNIKNGLRILDRYNCSTLSICKNMILDEFGGIDYSTEVVSNAICNLIKRKDANLHVWTITDWREAYSVESIGVDAILADYPRLFDFIR